MEAFDEIAKGINVNPMSKNVSVLCSNESEENKENHSLLSMQIYGSSVILSLFRETDG